MPRRCHIHPDLLAKAAKYKAKGYTYRSITAITGLSKAQMQYHLLPGMKERKKQTMARYFAQKREQIRKQQNEKNKLIKRKEEIRKELRSKPFKLVSNKYGRLPY